MTDLLAEEQAVLEDIFKRTGLRFRHLASIDRNDPELMGLILPIVREWVTSVSEKARRALYMQFLTPYALPFLGDILVWAPSASRPLDMELFTQILSILVTPKTAERIWTVFITLEPTQLDFLLLARLARVGLTSEQAIERIMRFLRSAATRIEHGERVRTFALSALQEYSRLRHVKVKEWFRQYANSADPDLRAMARRSSGAKSALPDCCRVHQRDPDPSRMILSTEIDDERIAEFQLRFESEFGAKLLAGTEPEEVVDNVTDRSWLVCDVAGSKRGPLEVWLRREDTGTLEISILMPESLGPS